MSRVDLYSIACITECSPFLVTREHCHLLGVAAIFMTAVGHSRLGRAASSCPGFALNGHHGAATRCMLSGDKRTWLRPLRNVQAPARSSLSALRGYDRQRVIWPRPAAAL